MAKRRLWLNDGFTIKDETPEVNQNTGDELPVLAFEYRPALPEALYNWQFDTRQAGMVSGAAILEVDAKFLFAHLVSWDAVTRGPADQLIPAPLTIANIKATPKPYLDYMMQKISSWSTPKGKEETAREKAEKNSGAA